MSVKSWTYLLTAAAVACAPSIPDPKAPPTPPAQGAVKVGKAYYTTHLPKGEGIPIDDKHRPAKPKLTSDFNQVVVSNDWWSSLIWSWFDGHDYSENMYPHPLTLKAAAEGLEMAYPTKLTTSNIEYMYRHDADLVVGLQQLNAKATNVAAYSDWTVTADWTDGGSTLRATMGHGLPYVYYTTRGSADARVRIPEGKSASIWRDNESALGITVDGHHYGLFAPSKARWSKKGDLFTSDLNGKNYFSVAVLPDAEVSTLELFSKHAHAHVVNTQVTWEYDEENSTVTARYQATTDVKESGEGLSDAPIMALYRHQWLNSDADFLPQTYHSPRGEMKLVEGDSFTTKVKWLGVLPVLPKTAETDPDFSESRLVDYIKDNTWVSELFPKGLTPVPLHDTYWVGKSLGKHSTILQIADQVERSHERDLLLQSIKNELIDWFDGSAPHHFYYNDTWRTLIGYPSTYWSGEQMNDHHFHYAYFIMAAAVVAQYDQQFVKDYGPFVDLLIKDPANWERDDKRFPFLREMDPYAGHSWANGPSLFPEGNNQEASSEDLNFSAALIFWGSTTGNEEIRDLGMYLYSTQVEAVKQYWFDVDKKVHPKEFGKPTAAVVWGAGGWYHTWFTEDPNIIHAINYVPFTGASTYHGRWPDNVLMNFNYLEKLNKGEIWNWRDYLTMYLATADGNRAVEMFERDPDTELEFGNCRAMLYHWVYTWRAMGHVNTEVTANVPTFGVFDKGKQRTHVAFNPDAKPRKVTFSDGVTLTVPPRKVAYKRAGSPKKN